MAEESVRPPDSFGVGVQADGKLLVLTEEEFEKALQDRELDELDDVMMPRSQQDGRGTSGDPQPLEGGPPIEQTLPLRGGEDEYFGATGEGGAEHKPVQLPSENLETGPPPKRRPVIIHNHYED